MMQPKRRRLPHFDVPGQPQFITFRLQSSLPASRHFPAAHLTSGEAFLSMDRLLDGARSGPTYLRQAPTAQLLLTTLHRGAEIEHYELHAWAILPNHVQLLITPRVSLSKLLAAIKAVAAKQANVFLRRTGQPFWQDESYDHLVRTADEFRRIQRYIESNPVTAGLTRTPEDYPWSSAYRIAQP